MFSRDNRSRFNSENRVDLDSFFTEAAEIFRPVEAATSERIWNNVKHNLPPSTKRRLRPLAVAIAATFLILAVGVGGFAWVHRLADRGSRINPLIRRLGIEP